MTAFFSDPVKQVSLADIRNTLIFRGDWETGRNCKVYPTFAEKQIYRRHKQIGQLPVPYQSWKGGHQYQLNIKQEDLKVYDKIQKKEFHQSFNQVQQFGLLPPSSLHDLHAPSIEQQWQTMNGREWPWMIIHN